MKKVLLGLSLATLLVCVSPGAAAAQAPTVKGFAIPVAGTSPGVVTSTTLVGVAAASDLTLLSDDYEGAVKWNANSSGWAITTTQAYGGTHSAHAPSSPNNLMIYGPFDLSAATVATLSFQLWYYAPKASFPPGTQNTAGAFLVGYSTNGSSFTFPYQWNGSTSGEWWPTTFNLGGWSLVGQPQVWIALGTTADPGALYSEGAYVDDLSLTATIPDTTPPTTTLSLDPAPNAAGWDKSPVTVTLTASDGPTGSGVAAIHYRLGGGTDTTYGGPFTISAEGTTTIQYWSVDNAAITEAANTDTIKIDETAPVTTCAVAGPYTGAATLHLAASDAPSGVATSTWSLNGTTWHSGTTVSIPAPGSYLLHFSSTDKAGNVEADKTVSVVVNKYTVKITKSPTGSLYTLTRRSGVAYWTFTGIFKTAAGALVKNKSVALQKSTNGTTWKTAYALTTNSYGKAVKRLAFRAAGTTYWRWYCASNAKYKAAASTKTKIVVR